MRIGGGVGGLYKMMERVDNGPLAAHKLVYSSGSVCMRNEYQNHMVHTACGWMGLGLRRAQCPSLFPYIRYLIGNIGMFDTMPTIRLSPPPPPHTKMLKRWRKIITVICYYLSGECGAHSEFPSKMGLMCVKLLLMYSQMFGINLINRWGDAREGWDRR